MNSYYYLVAQLPYLSYGAPALITSTRLRELCFELMSPDDAVLLEFCSLDPNVAEPRSSDSVEVLPDRDLRSDSSAFITRWLSWEHSLRLSIAKIRAQKLKREFVSPIESSLDDLSTAALAKAAVAMDSPLEAELFLDRARWDFIESLQGGDFFARDAVYAYMLKLLLIERRSLFRAEEGFSEYKTIYASVMEAAPTSIESGEPK